MAHYSQNHLPEGVKKNEITNAQLYHGKLTSIWCESESESESEDEDGSLVTDFLISQSMNSPWSRSRRVSVDFN